MKKLMMALVAVAFGCAAQAATVNWSTGVIKQISAADGTAGGATISSGYTATLIIYGADGAEVKSTGSGWSTSKVKATTVTSDDLVLGDKGYSYLLTIVGTVSDNSKNYADAIGKTATLTYSGTFNMNTQGTTTLQIMSTGASAAGAKWTVEDVPEPTSAMLMLLGMAGLALRRRRA